jgi:hypothetical protein
MIKCKIGVISKSRDKDCFLNLGEIFDKSIRQDVNTLYKLHQNLRYFCPFKATIKGKNVTPDNIEEISTLQKRYKLTRKIYVSGKIPNGKSKFLSPQLYDISCMVPLFPDKICKTVVQGKGSTTFMFILFPYTDPIVRGEIVDNCFSVVKDNRVCFYTIGGVYGNNTQSTCDLSRRYLLSCGVEDVNINRNQYDEFPDCIIEAMNMIDFLMPDTELKMFLGIQREDMNRVMNHIRLASKFSMFKHKLTLICN